MNVYALTAPLFSSRDNNGSRFGHGKYQFPFECDLPLDAVPSMDAKSNSSDDENCSVIYKLEARLHRRSWFKWDIPASKVLTVLNSPMDGSVPKSAVFVPPKPQDIYKWWIIRTGAIKLGMYTPASILHPNEDFDVSFVVDNSSTSLIKTVDLEVTESVTWKASDSFNSRTASLDTVLFRKQLESKDYDLSRLPYMMNDTEAQTVLEKAIIDPKQTKNVHTVKINTQARPTMASTELIKVKHFLSIKARTSFGATNPIISFPITILHNTDAYKAVEVSTNAKAWNPRDIYSSKNVNSNLGGVRKLSQLVVRLFR